MLYLVHQLAHSTKMKLSPNTNNLIRVALLTSPVIGLLISISPFNHVAFSIPAFLLSVFVGISFSFLIWLVNIYLIHIQETGHHFRLNNIVRFVLSYLINVSIIAILILIIKVYVFSNQNLELTRGFREESGIFVPILMGFLLNTVVVVIAESVVLRNKKTMVELENTQLRNKNTEAFYLQLKQQIHPHFLFNSLNILKTLIKKNPDAAVDYIIKLSDFLRVAISSNNSNTVKLEEELKLCLDYLEMQKIRFGKALEYSFDIADEVKYQGFVPVFAIQLLIENAIKHNSLTENSPLKIDVIHRDGWIKVSNNLQAKSNTESSTGLGLINLTERYKMLSDSSIEIFRNENVFSVSIKILSQ